MADKRLIHSLNAEELAAACAELGAEPYRARQIWQWLYRHRVADWDAMRNLPLALRAQLRDTFEIQAAVPAEQQDAAGEVRKLLVRLSDGACVEQVLIPADTRRTVCVSSQVGCAFGCAFCASGQGGFARNLEAGEIVGQVLIAARAWGDRPSHVVVMGMGEPLDNYDAVLKAVRIVNDENGLGIGARRVTISTCGLVPGIQRLAGEGLQVELSVSLHAAEDGLRSHLMPVNRRHPLGELLGACDAYTARTGRIVTYEYTLIAGVNDAAAQAEGLARLLSGRACRVKLIPLSPVEEFAGRASPETAQRLFVGALARARINATVRHSQGGAVRAACGQLRGRMETLEKAGSAQKLPGNAENGCGGLPSSCIVLSHLGKGNGARADGVGRLER